MLSHHAQRPLIFLDLDDVLVLNSTYGGYDVALALAPGAKAEDVASDMWEQLMAPEAVLHLRSIHEEFRPWYVLSTSWAMVMDDATLREALQRSGLGFVVEALHPEMTTPKGRQSTRWTQVSGWLSAHPEFADRWVVLDDELSGTGLAAVQPIPVHPFIVLCRAEVGLTYVEYLRLRAALQARNAASQ